MNKKDFYEKKFTYHVTASYGTGQMRFQTKRRSYPKGQKEFPNIPAKLTIDIKTDNIYFLGHSKKRGYPYLGQMILTGSLYCPRPLGIVYTLLNHHLSTDHV